MNQQSSEHSQNNTNESTSISRRNFVTAAAATSVGVAAIGPALFNQTTSTAVAGNAYQAGSDIIRVGLVGCGGRGTGAATQALNADPGVHLVAMADAFADHLQASLARLKQHSPDRVTVSDETAFVGFDAYKQLIASDVHVVLFATPPVFRPMHIRAAIEAGKHVFCEKPMGVDAPGVRSVIETALLAKQKHLSLVSGFCWRYATQMRDTFEQLHNRAIGQIRSVQCTYNTGPLGDVARQPEWSDMEWQLRNWKAFNYLSGEHIVEQAVHAIDWINWAYQAPPIKAYAVGGRIARSGKWTGNMFDHFGVFYEFEDGNRAYHMCRQIANCSNDNTGYLIGEKGSCTINPWTPVCVIEGENPWRWKGRKNDMYQQEHNELFDSIRSGNPMNDGEWMARTTLMGIMGREAAYTGKTITWDEMLNSKKSYTPKHWEWSETPFPPVPVPGQTQFS